MAKKKPMVFIDGRAVTTDSNLFQEFINAATKNNIEIDFKGAGHALKLYQDTMWGIAPFFYTTVLEYDAISQLGKKIRLSQMIGVKEKDLPRYHSSNGKILTMDKLITADESVSLFNKDNGLIVSIHQSTTKNKVELYANKGFQYNGEFEGLKPEGGKINHPRLWLERLVQSYNFDK